MINLQNIALYYSFAGDVFFQFKCTYFCVHVHIWCVAILIELRNKILKNTEVLCII